MSTAKLDRYVANIESNKQQRETPYSMQPQNHSSSSVITNGGHYIVAGNTNAVGKTTLNGPDNNSHKDMISATMDDMKNTEQTLF